MQNAALRPRKLRANYMLHRRAAIVCRSQIQNGAVSRYHASCIGPKTSYLNVSGQTPDVRPWQQYMISIPCCIKAGIHSYHLIFLILPALFLT